MLSFTTNIFYKLNLFFWFWQRLDDVQEFLKVPKLNLKSRQVKIHHGPLSQHVQNWEEVQKTLKGTGFENFLLEDYRK